MSRAIAVAAALTLGAYGLVRGTWAVGGSDSSCYALMAVAFMALGLSLTQRFLAQGQRLPLHGFRFRDLALIQQRRAEIAERTDNLRIFVTQSPAAGIENLAKKLYRFSGLALLHFQICQNRTRILQLPKFVAHPFLANTQRLADSRLRF